MITAESYEKLARTVAGLYNNTIVAPAALMFGNAGPAKMTAEMAAKTADMIIERNGVNFDYLAGHLMKVHITPDAVVTDGWLYDRDSPMGHRNAIEDGLTDPYYDKFDWAAAAAKHIKRETA